MKLLVLSDLHLECADLAILDSADFDVVILAGDIVNPGSGLSAWVRASPALQRARAIVAVSGNHEHYDRVMQHETVAMHTAARALQSPPLHLLDCDQVVVDGVRFLGCTLWTDFALHIDTPEGPRSDPRQGITAAGRDMADYRTIGWLDEAAASDGIATRKLTPYDTLRLHHTQRTWLEAALAEPFDGSTVVVTHHGPHRGSLAQRFAADWVSTGYLSELPVHFFEVPVLWVHGHTHTSHDYQVGGCRMLCNPRGYQWPGQPMPENEAFDATCVVQVQSVPRGTGAARGTHQEA